MNLFRVLRIIVALVATYIIIIIFGEFLSFDNDNQNILAFPVFLFSEENAKYSIDNSLFLSQPRFQLPRNNGDIFGWMKFAVFPIEELDKVHNRIYNQMRYVPSNYDSETQNKYKLILLYNGDHGYKNEEFQRCPVKHCKFTFNISHYSQADVVLWISHIYLPNISRPPNQIWSFFFHESPEHTPNIHEFEKKRNSLINWTISYRPDSTIPVLYAYYSPYDLTKPPPERYPLTNQSYYEGKTKMVAWFASNCKAVNSRLQIVKKLSDYIQVDIYGRCGNLSCPRYNESKCFDLLNSTYKFYLAFENSNCRHYITEKFFINGLSLNVIPIVMGAHPDDYKGVAPPHSYIHVDDFKTLEALANYLKYLDKNNTAYNEYFSWKEYGTVNFEQNFLCRLCMMTYEAERTQTYYNDLNTWWKGKNGNICFKSGKWKDHNQY